MSESKVLGRFVWHELMTTHPEQAAEFYRKVVGWNAQSWENDSSYQLLATQDGMMAGLMPLPEEVRSMGAPPCWICYIGTPDVDQTAAQARALGGRVLRDPADIPSIGRFAVVQDPQGAVFTAFTPLSEGSGDRPVPPGDFSWHELMTTDWAGAFDFYHALFGWEKTSAMDMGPEAGLYQMFGWPEKTLGGMFNRPPQVSAPPHWLPYALVEDCRALVDTITGLGGRVLYGPMEVPGGDWVVQFMDPQGAVFALHSHKPVAAVKKRPVTKKKPAAKRMAAKKKPTAKKTAVRKTTSKKTAKKATKKTTAKKVAVVKSKKKVAGKPAGKKAVTRRPASKKAVARKPAAKKAAKKKPSSKKRA